MKTLKSKRLFTLIWVVLALSSLASVLTLVKGILQFSAQPILFWLTVLKLVTVAILLMMGLNLWKVVKAYTGSGNWQSGYYQKVKQMGYWAIALTVLNALFQVGYEFMFRHLSGPAYVPSGLYVFQRFYATLLWESPGMWVLALSILLFAELLNSAHQVKAENESFI